MQKIVTAILFFSASLTSYAAPPTCHQHSGGNYCKYKGTVKTLYVNASNLILLYFEDPVDVDVANSLGMNISNASAAALKIANNAEFANLFYSTALAAHASGREIQIQMRGSESGYLKIDRVWSYQE